MRAVVQRVTQASVSIHGIVHGKIGPGFLVLAGISTEDTMEDASWMARKIVGMRIFSDKAGLMNLDILQTEGSMLVISQFTLLADYKKGNRPSFITAARPETAIPIYEQFIHEISQLMGKPPQTGIFGEDMKVSLINDGPVTIVMDSKTKD